MMLSSKTKPGFKISLHLKDLANILETGKDVDAPVPLSAMVEQFMQILQNSGMAMADHSALIHYYENLAGIKVNK